jgi:hypothetical protein
MITADENIIHSFRLTHKENTPVISHNSDTISQCVCKANGLSIYGCHFSFPCSGHARPEMTGYQIHTWLRNLFIKDWATPKWLQRIGIKWRAIYQQYLPQVKTDWMTEWGPDLASDCNFDQHKYAYIIVRQMLANWMVGITMQVIYADGDYGYSLFAADDDFKGSHLRRANLALEKLTTITGQKPIQSYTNPTTNSGIWSVTLTGSPTTQITWVPKGSAKVTVPQGSTCMDLYGDNVALSTQGITESVTMDESAGVYYFTLAN